MVQAWVRLMSLLQQMMLILKTLRVMRVKQVIALDVSVPFVLMLNEIAFSSPVAIASLVISVEQSKFFSN